MLVCNFFPHGSGKGSQKTHKNFTGGCTVQMVRLYWSLYEKTVEDHFYKGGFFCALAHGHSMPVAIFPHGSKGGIPRNAQKFTGGCGVQHGEVDIVRKTGRKSLL